MALLFVVNLVYEILFANEMIYIVAIKVKWWIKFNGWNILFVKYFKCLRWNGLAKFMLLYCNGHISSMWVEIKSYGAIYGYTCIFEMRKGPPDMRSGTTSVARFDFGQQSCRRTYY